MSKSKSSAPPPPPELDQNADINNSLFGAMMERQARNRQTQMMQSLERQQQMGMPQGLINFQQQLPNNWLGILQALGQQNKGQGG